MAIQPTVDEGSDRVVARSIGSSMARASRTCGGRNGFVVATTYRGRIETTTVSSPCGRANVSQCASGLSRWPTFDHRRLNFYYEPESGEPLYYELS